MANEASLRLLFLSFLTICCSGTLVGFSCHERGETASSTSAAIIFLHKNKIPPSQIRIFVTDPSILSTLTNSNVSVDFCLNKSLVEIFVASKSSGVLWLKAHLVNFLPQVDIKSIIASCGSDCLGQNERPLLVSTLKSIHSVLSRLQIGREVKVSVAFPLSFLEKLNASYENDLLRILRFIKKINSFVMMEDSIGEELSMGNHFVQSVIERATLAASILPCKDVPVVLTIKSPITLSSMEIAQFNEGVSKYLEARGNQITKRIAALYAEVHTTEDFTLKGNRREEEEIFFLPRSENQSKFRIRRTLDEANNPPNIVFPTNPTSDTPVITVPSTNPVTVYPSNPAAMPVTVPSTTPVPLPPTNPVNSPVPVTNPVTTPITVPGSQPETNPVTSYPPPSGSVPVINPLPPPASTNAPAITGQSWCVAKTGVPETALQSALDYACGTGSADCSQILQGGSCYNPNSIVAHASFAFNSYYQKNPTPTSCDFGGTATIVNTNPSSGSCIYPSSSSGAGTSGSGTSPVSNSGNTASGNMPAFGSASPPDAYTTSSSHSAGLRPFLGCMVLVIPLVTGRLSMRS